MAKERTTIPPEIAVDVMFTHDGTCCVCWDKGLAVQIHHIDENPTNHSKENLAVLCLEDHNKTQLKGGFGRKLGPPEVTKFRDDWIARVAKRRDEADKLAAQKMASAASSVGEPAPSRDAKPSERTLVAYINSLPALSRQALANAQPRFDSGISTEMRDAGYGLIELYKLILV